MKHPILFKLLKLHSDINDMSVIVYTKTKNIIISIQKYTSEVCTVFR